MRSRAVALFLPVILCACTAPSAAQDPSRAWTQPWPEFLTIAESSDWKATSTHAQVIDYCERLAAASPRVHMEQAGRTLEGRSLPILVIADPPVRSAADVGDRLVAFAWAGIHSGEVCGKPATLMLARAMAAPGAHPLLKDLVVIFLPLLNADGNDRMDPGNRPGQQGPVEGMGTRPNAAGLNINRDFTKLDTEEARALAQVFRTWQPVIAMDLHTTNGSRHRYVLTYDGQRHPACDPDLLQLTRKQLLPEVSTKMAEDTGYLSFFYGNFANQYQDWAAYPASLRYSTHYGGMRHMLSILSEAYSYAGYRDRVLSTKSFVEDCFLWVAEHKHQVRDAIAQARQRTIALGNAPAADNLIALRQESRFEEGKYTVLGYAGGGGRRNTSSETKDYQLRYNGLSVATHSVTRPWAYVLPAASQGALENLGHHGIEMQVLSTDLVTEVEVYRVGAVQRRERKYEGHQMVTVEVAARRERQRLEAGSILVRCAQPLGSLAAFLLEPESEDGLCTWNFFDAELEVGRDFPVLRLPAAVKVQTRPYPPRSGQ